MKRQRSARSTSLSAVVAAGLAATVAAALTSGFGVAGTILGAALTTMIITAGSALLGSYLEGTADRVRKVPGRVRGRISPDAPAPGMRVFSRRRWRSMRFGSLAAGAFALCISLVAVTGVEAGAGKSLSCLVWGQCPVVAAASGGQAVDVPTGTSPSLLGGGGRLTAAQQTAAQEEPRAPRAAQTPGAYTEPAAASGSQDGVPQAAGPERTQSEQPGARPSSQEPRGGEPQPAPQRETVPEESPAQPQPAQPQPVQPQPAQPAQPPEDAAGVQD